MSIALQRSGNRIEPDRIIRGISCVPVYDPPAAGGERVSPASAPPISLPAESPRELDTGTGSTAPPPWGGEEEEATSCSSSIGKNSDCSRGSAASDGEDSGEPEVQSAPKGPLDSTGALEDALPIRRGISKFYSGKSKSFTSLADVSSSSSAKGLGKPENAYTRKRKNLLAFSVNWDRHQGGAPPRGNGGSVPKRPANSGRSTASSDSNGAEVEPRRNRPPLHPNGKVSPPPPGDSPLHRCHFAVRSFSLTDLQGATAPASSCIVPMDKRHRRPPQ